jgi:hypothetical protein
MGRDGRPLLERLEDRLADLGRHPGSGILDHHQRAAASRLDPHPHRRAGGGVPCRIRQQVLDDPLDLGGVDRDQHGRGLQADGSLAEQLRPCVLDNPAD